MVVHTFNLSSQEAKAGDLCKFQSSLGYVVRPCLKTKTKTILLTTAPPLMPQDLFLFVCVCILLLIATCVCRSHKKELDSLQLKL